MPRHSLSLTLTQAAVAAVNITRDHRNREAMDLLKRLLATAQAEVARIEGANTNNVDLRYLSPCPPGYDTVVGYLAKVNPDLLDLMDKTPEATQRDNAWLRIRTEEDGGEVIKVDAPAVFRNETFRMVEAYPIAHLQEHLGG